VETAHPSSLNVSIIWFSCKLGPSLFGASVLALFAPYGLQQAPWGVFDRLLANEPKSAGVGPQFFVE
jgi:hypothetical protein